MEYSPPPLFKQGAPARVKATVFALISIALLMIDSRVQSLATIRQVAGTALYPFQMIALMPRDALGSVGSYFSSLAALQKEVDTLRANQVAYAQLLQQARHATAENAQLRRLMGAAEHVPVRSIMAEILYDARDPSSRRVVIDRGTMQDVKAGLPVIDNAGVVGQVTRVFPLTAEVTLLTDKEQVIPVQLLRNGLRSVAFGRGQSGQLELRFVAPNADIQVGDVLVTSGLDGVYPAGLAVAKVVQVESSATGAFGRVVCQPLAGIDRHRQLLVLMDPPPRAPLPAPEAAPADARKLPDMPAISVPPGAAPVGGAARATAAPAANAPATAARNAAAAPAPAPGTTGAAAAPSTQPAPARAAVPQAAAARPAATQPTATPRGNGQ